jgi:hypothetical protein
MKRKFSSSPIINIENKDKEDNFKKEWNLKVLKIECNRKYLRAFKKVITIVIKFIIYFNLYIYILCR